MSLSINDTNDDILIKFFSFLKVKDLIQIAGVCTKWYTISSNDIVWGNIQFFEKSPTPSPIKEHTIMVIVGEALPLFKKMKQIPNWPDYNTECVPGSCTEKKEWLKKHQQRTYSCTYLTSDFTKLDLTEKGCYATQVKVMELFTLVVAAFEMYICCERIGFTSLNEIEALALKTRNTFHNPYPFLILEQEYKKKGKDLKAAEMHQIAQEYS